MLVAHPSSLPTIETNETHAPGRPPRLCVSPSARIVELALAGLAAELQPALEQHPQTAGADRMAEGLQAAVGVDRQLAVEVERRPPARRCHASPRSENPRSSISTSSVGVKQSCTSAIEISVRGFVTPACA